jgi:ABC-type transport system substrate-binding protein
MMGNYWHSALSNRISRRRALAMTGGAALLAACGGSDSDDGVQGDRSGLITAPEDTSRSARRGGEYLHFDSSDIASFDPSVPVAALTRISAWNWSRLVSIKPGVLERSRDEIDSDIAESWEWSPDRLQLTMRIRPDVKFSPIAPVNGRALTVQDIMFSWERATTVGQLRSQLNANNSNALILSLESPDPRTLVLKLKEPLVYALDLLAQSTTGYLHILPREADGGYDPRHTAIGTGPFMLRPEDYTPSVGAKFRRNPNYYMTDRPYFDAVNRPIVSEYSTGLAQFKAGGLHTYTLQPEDILSVKRGQPELLMYQTDADGTETVGGMITVFGYKRGPQSPFFDERVRQAYSMSIDRELFIDTFYNVSTFESEGIPMTSIWNTVYHKSIAEGWLIDPRSRDFGPNARYFQYNIEEAKKLLAAAGHASGVEVASNHFTSTELGPDYPRQIDVLEAMVADAGFRFAKNIITNREWNSPAFRDAKGQFEGYGFRRGPAPPAGDAVALLEYHFHSRGDAFLGFDAGNRGDHSGDPMLETDIIKMRGELDNNRRKSISDDVQRYLAQKQYYTRWPGGASGFTMAWPALKNVQVFRGGGFGTPFVQQWLDDSLPPHRRS